MLVAELGDDLVPVGRIPQHRGGDPAAARACEDACRGVMADGVEALVSTTITNSGRYLPNPSASSSSTRSDRSDRPLSPLPTNSGSLWGMSVVGLVLQKRRNQPKGTRGLLLAHLGDKLLELLLRGHTPTVDTLNRPTGKLAAGGEMTTVPHRCCPIAQTRHYSHPAW